MADGQVLSLTRVGCVFLDVWVNGKAGNVKITDVYLAPRLARNILSYVRLERKGYQICYDGAKRVLSRRSDGRAVFDVLMDNNVLYVDTSGPDGNHQVGCALVASLETAGNEGTDGDVQEGSLMHFHQRFVHLFTGYDRAHGS